MCVISQLPKDMGGVEGKAAYIDTEGTFRPERIAQIAERFGLDPDTAQQNITYARCVNSEASGVISLSLNNQLTSDSTNWNSLKASHRSSSLESSAS